jgi:hypothetical protein
MGHILSAKHLNRPAPSRTSEYAFGYSNLPWLGIDFGSYGGSVGYHGMGHILSTNHPNRSDPP